ncbi:MAG: hypothetical protein WC654_08495 [Patescibacteria group bacterium]
MKTTLFLLFFLAGCVHRPIGISVVETNNGVAIASNVPPGQTLDLLQGLTQRETMGGALEKGVPATIWNNGLPLAQVGGNQFPIYGTNGAAYSLDPLAIASSLAAERMHGVSAQTRVPANQASSSEIQKLQQDVGAIQRWIGVQENTP